MLKFLAWVWGEFAECLQPGGIERRRARYREKLGIAPPTATPRVRITIWYQDPNRLTYIATYTNEKHMQQEMEAAAHYGWQPQGTTAQNGKFSAGKAVAGGVLLGPVGLLAGTMGNKDKVTITYVRSQAWKEQNGMR